MAASSFCPRLVVTGHLDWTVYLDMGNQAHFKTEKALLKLLAVLPGLCRPLLDNTDLQNTFALFSVLCCGIENHIIYKNYIQLKAEAQ